MVFDIKNSEIDVKSSHTDFLLCEEISEDISVITQIVSFCYDVLDTFTDWYF